MHSEGHEPMTSRIGILTWGIIGLLAACCTGQVPEITSLQGNGRLAWTNSAISNAVYRVEWASQAGGPWHSFTYQPINSVDAHSNTEFSVEVPMFYRVVMETNEFPQGMVWIDGGDVELGDIQGLGRSDERPVHTNFVSGFWMDEMEVSKTKWDEVYNWAITNGYAFQNSGLCKTNNHPVMWVNWYDCVKWCNARSQKTGLTPCYYTDEGFSALYTNGAVNISNEWVRWTANGYRLPTEAEWEKAAKGGRQGRLFPWGGDTIQHTRANYRADTNGYVYDTSLTDGHHPIYNDGVLPYTSPVGSFAANGYGLHDMAGNVAEWCWDWYGYYTTGYLTDPHGPAKSIVGSFRIVRSGGAHESVQYARCTARFNMEPGMASNSDVGFRCVKGR
jgi:formylglycine-generating enzyme required for sulfatase activity